MNETFESLKSEYLSNPTHAGARAFRDAMQAELDAQAAEKGELPALREFFRCLVIEVLEQLTEKARKLP